MAMKFQTVVGIATIVAALAGVATLAVTVSPGELQFIEQPASTDVPATRELEATIEDEARQGDDSQSSVDENPVQNFEVPFFDSSDENHRRRHESFLNIHSGTIADKALPISLRSWLSEVDFGFDNIEQVLAGDHTRYYELELDFRTAACEELFGSLDYMFQGYNWRLCWGYRPPGRGSSAEFSIFWSRNRLKETLTDQDIFPFEFILEVNEYQHRLLTSLREYLSRPSNLRSSYEDRRVEVQAMFERMSPEDRAGAAARLRRLSDLFALVSEICSSQDCSPSEVDFSLATDRWDTGHFIGTSPMDDWIDYSPLFDWEVVAVEFAARRYIEGGTDLLGVYVDLFLDAATIAENT